MTCFSKRIALISGFTRRFSAFSIAERTQRNFGDRKGLYAGKVMAQKPNKRKSSKSKKGSIILAGFRRLSILGLILVLLVLPTIVSADLRWFNELEIQGAEVVSEGAYFRFLMVNHYGFPIYVAINNGDPIYIPTNGSASYNVIAPQISKPYESVLYTFTEYLQTPQPANFMGTVDFPVTVVSINFIDSTIYYIYITNLMTAVGLFAVVTAFILWHRRLFTGRVKLKKNEMKNRNLKSA
jgi:hypothetical protein